MSTRLTLSDSALADDGWVELCAEPESCRKFWAVALQFAVADGADGVVFDLDHPEDCLAVRIEAELHVMDPPPFELRESLLAAMLQLADGNVSLEAEGGDVQWRVRPLKHGVRLDRVASLQ